MTKINKDSLVDVDGKDWPDLLESLKKYLPRSLPIYGWIQVRRKWQKYNPEGNEFHICSPASGYMDGLVIFGKVLNKTYFVTFFTFHNDYTKITEAVLTTKRIDWSEVLNCAVPEENLVWMKEVLTTLGYNVYKNLQTDFYELPKEKALEVSERVPENNIFVEQLNTKDVNKIDSLWPFRFEGSDKFLQEFVVKNIGYGVYSKDDKNLLSWVMQCEYGEIGTLQTDEGFKRKGYAKLVLEAISKKLAENDELVFAFIVKGNTASIELFQGLGFKWAGLYNFLYFNKTFAKL